MEWKMKVSFIYEKSAYNDYLCALCHFCSPLSLIPQLTHFFIPIISHKLPKVESNGNEA